MKKALKTGAYILLWSIIICVLIIGLRYLKVEINGESKHWFIGFYTVIGGLYSSLAVIPTFLLLDYFIYIPKIKKKFTLNSLRLFTLLFLVAIVAIIEYFYF